MSGDPEDYSSAWPELEDETPSMLSPLALAVLWVTCAVLAIVGVAVLLAVVSALIGGHFWWVR